jgi:hypothetical protein
VGGGGSTSTSSGSGGGDCVPGPCDDGDDCTENDTCSNGSCEGTPIVCTPPAATCLNPNTARTYSWAGTCSSSSCDFTPTDTLCPAGCSGGACVLDPNVTVSAGSAHTCALTAAGGAKCWGLNESGRLGNNSDVESHVAVSVVGLSSGVAAIVAGGGHSCALTTGGGVKCWGNNSFGQLGNNSLIASQVPVDVLGLGTTVVAIAAGGLHTCARTSAGGIKCWGDNFWGGLGNNSTLNSSVPVDVVGL